MCSSKPPKVKPVAAPPTASPEALDQIAMEARDRERRRVRNAYGRQATILAGSQQAPAGGQYKTALGS